jgi:hypothetical protein
MAPDRIKDLRTKGLMDDDTFKPIQENTKNKQDLEKLTDSSGAENISTGLYRDLLGAHQTYLGVTGSLEKDPTKRAAIADQMRVVNAKIDLDNANQAAIKGRPVGSEPSFGENLGVGTGAGLPLTAVTGVGGVIKAGVIKAAEAVAPVVAKPLLTQVGIKGAEGAGYGGGGGAVVGGLTPEPGIDPEKDPIEQWYQKKTGTVLSDTGSGILGGLVFGGLSPMVKKGLNAAFGTNQDTNMAATAAEGKQWGVKIASGNSGLTNAAADNLNASNFKQNTVNFSSMTNAQTKGYYSTALANIKSFPNYDQLVATAAGPTDKRQITAKAILDVIHNSPNDYQLAKASNDSNLLNKQLFADQKYAQASAKSGTTEIRRDRTFDALDPNTPSSVLNNALSQPTEIGDQEFQYGNNRTTIGKYLTEVSQRLDQPTTFQDLSTISKTLGSAFNQMPDGSLAKTALSDVRKAVLSDMKKGGQASGAWQSYSDASDYTRDVVKPLQTSEASKLINRAAGGTQSAVNDVYKKFSDWTNPTVVNESISKEVFAQLDPMARNAVKSGLIARAVQSSTTKGAVNYRSLSDQLTQLLNKSELDFKGFDKFDVQGLSNVAEHLALQKEAGAGKLPKASPGGIMAKFAGAAAAGAEFFHMLSSGQYVQAGGVAATGGGTYGMYKFMQSGRGQKFVRSASSMKPGSPQLENLINKMVTTMSIGTSNTKLVPKVAAGMSLFGGQSDQPMEQSK